MAQIFSESNIEAEQNVTYTKTIPLNVDWNTYFIEKLTININGKNIILRRNYVDFYSNEPTLILAEGTIKIDDGTINYSITGEYINYNYGPDNLIITYTYVPIEKTTVNNKLVIQKDENNKQSVNVQLNSIVGTNKSNYSNRYYYNPDISNLSVGGTYYDIEYSIVDNTDDIDIQPEEIPYTPPIG